MAFARYHTALRAAVSGETKAYGFTLVIWATGALADAERGSPGRLGAVAFIAGALCGMAVTVLLAFGRPTATWTQQQQRRHAVGAIHVLSVGGAVALGWGVAVAISDKVLAYLASGVAAVIAYQLLLGMEVALSTADSSSERADVSDGGHR
jgi:hypothetical protein